MEQNVRHRHAARRHTVINVTCICLGVVFIALCFVFLSLAFKDVRQCKKSNDCGEEVYYKGKILRIVAAGLFIIGFGLMSAFWWRLRAFRSVRDLQARIEEMENRGLQRRASVMTKTLGQIDSQQRNLG